MIVSGTPVVAKQHGSDFDSLVLGIPTLSIFELVKNVRLSM